MMPKSNLKSCCLTSEFAIQVALSLDIALPAIAQPKANTVF